MALSAPPALAAPPDGQSGPAIVTGSEGRANPFFGVAPDGTDLVLWTVAGSQAGENTFVGAVRKPGSTTWTPVPSPVVDKKSAQDAVIAGTKSGDFWLAWQQYNNAGFPEVFVRKYDTSKGTWSKRQQPFRDHGYKHGAASIAVTGSGEVVLGVYAKPVVSTTPSTYRAEVGILRPGKGWSTTFLSAADTNSSRAQVAASPNGYLAATWIVGSQVAQMTVNAATHTPSATAKWHKATLSVPGDAQKTAVSIGPDGTAAVAWPASSTSFDSARMAVTDANDSSRTWTTMNLVTGTTVGSSVLPVVDRAGGVRAFWTDPNALWSLYRTGGTQSAPALVGTLDRLQPMVGAGLLADGNVAVYYAEYSTGPATEGLRRARFDGESALGFEEFTNAGNGDTNSAIAGSDAAARTGFTYYTGTYPDYSIQNVDQSGLGPAVVRSAYDARPVTKPKAKGLASVGSTLTCVTGYWVETSKVKYKWFRDGHVIKGATHRVYQLVSWDRGHAVSCTAVGKDTSGHHLGMLTSHARTIY